MLKSKLISDRVKRVDSANVTADRYNFLGLEQAEPNLGSAAANGYVLTYNTDSQGNRLWAPGGLESNLAYSHANAAFNAANNAVDTWVRDAANSASSYANAAFSTANGKYSSTGGTISGDVTITGNLVVEGNTVTVNVSSLSVEDSLIQLARNNTTDALDIGFIGHYDGGSGNVHAGLIRRASDDSFYLFDNLPTEPLTNIVDVANSSIATLRANLISNNVLIREYDPINHTNSAYTHANAAFLAANNAVDTWVRDAANSASSYANSGYIHANSAYDKINTTTTLVNSMFGVTVTVDNFNGNNACTTFTLSREPVTENFTIITLDGIVQHKTAYSVSGANVVFSEAPNTNVDIEVITFVSQVGIPVGVDLTLNSFTGDNSCTSFTLTTVPKNENYTSVVIDGISQLKSSYSVSGNVLTFTEAPNTNANIEITTILGADEYVSNSLANMAFTHANAAFDKANSANVLAQAAFDAANNAVDTWVRDAANAASSYANSAFSTANSKFDSTGGTISGDVNIVGNLTITGETTYSNTTTVNLGDSILTLNADIPGNLAPSENAGLEVDRGLSDNVQLIWDESIDKWTFTNDGTLYSNVGSAAAESYANSAFGIANIAYDRATTSGDYANSAFGVANTARLHANVAFDTANTANTNATNAYGHAISGYVHANAAYDAANNATDTWVRSATNSASSYANSAYIHANAAFAAANSGANATDTWVRDHANAAFTKANSDFQISINLDTFTGDNSCTSFTLSTLPANENYTIVSVDGILQLKSAYSLSGNVITFSEAPSTNANIDVTVFTQGVPFVVNNSTALITVDTFTGDNACTTFTLTKQPLSENYTIISVDGVLQNKSSYNISGFNLVFSEAPASNSSIDVTVITEAVPTYLTSDLDTFEFVLTNGQTVLSNNSMAVTSNSVAHVYKNGILLAQTDFIKEPSNNTIILTTAGSANDEVTVLIYSSADTTLDNLSSQIAAAFIAANNASNTANGGLLTSGGTILGNLRISGNITPTDDLTSNIGNSTHRFHTVFVGPGSIDIDGITLSNSGGLLTISEPLSVQGITLQNVNGQLSISGGVGGTSDFVLSSQTAVRFSDADNSNYIELKAPATLDTNVTLILPSQLGTANQVLALGTDGTLTWANTAIGATSTRSVSLSQSGTLEPTTGTARWYAPTNLTATSVTTRLANSSTSNVTVNLLKNGAQIRSFTVPSNQTKINSQTPFTMVEDDYLTVDVLTTGGEDLNITILYTLEG